MKNNSKSNSETITNTESGIITNNGNINIISNNSILIQGSNLNSKSNDINLQAENTIDIRDATTKEYHNTTVKKTNRGIYRGITNVVSAVTDVALLGTNMFLSVAAPIYENLASPIKKVSPDNGNNNILNNLDYKNIKRKEKDLIYNNSLHNNSIKNTNEQSNTKIVSSNIKTGKDLTLKSNNTINIKASNLISNNGNIDIETNILNILADETQTSITNNQTTKTTFINKYGTNGDITYNTEDTNIIVNNNNSNNNNNITFNIKDKLNIQTSENKKDKVIDYINYLNNSTNNNTNNNNPSITQSILKTNDEHINETTRQMTDVAQISVAAGAVAVSIITGGIGSGVSGAMMTAATTTAGTIATNTTIQTSLNAEGDIFKQIKDITSETIKTTTSEDSLKSIAIAAGIAGLSRWVVDKFGGGTTLDRGDNSKVVYKPDKSILDDYRKLNPDYNGVLNKTANNIGRANTTTDISLVNTVVNTEEFGFWQNLLNEGGTMSRIVNKIKGMNTMSLFHDPLTNNSILSITPLLETSIIPATIIQYCATFPGLCGATINHITSNGSKNDK